MQINDDVTLVWSDAEQRPTNEQWSGKAAERWPSLGEAIRFAIAMQADKAALGLSPWIWTPSGHVYSPGTITAMGRAFEENMLRARYINGR